MKSPAQRHIERVSARGQSSLEDPPSHNRHTALMLAKLATDRQRLKSIQSIERKLAVKREVLPDYEDYVAGVLEGKPGVQDEVFATVMVWRIDVGDFEAALDMADYALQHDLPLPSQYERTLATFITEEISQAALADPGFSIAILQKLSTLVESHDMPDPVRAKLHKAIGLQIASTDRATALLHLRRALTLNNRCGVKKDMDRLEREQVQAAEAQNASLPIPCLTPGRRKRK